MKYLLKITAIIAYIMLLVMCCIMFVKSCQFEPRLPLINDYKLNVEVTQDSTLSKRGKQELYSLIYFLQKTKKEEYAEGINDVRQETNNIINKINGWLSFWLAILALVGGVLPVVISWRQEQDNNKKFSDLTDKVNSKLINLEDRVQGKIDDLNNLHTELKSFIEDSKKELEKQRNKRELHETHINITNIISSFIAAKNNKLIEDSYERDLLRISLLKELAIEFDKITDCIFNDDYQQDCKVVLQTILIQFYSLYASLRITLLKVHKTQYLEITINKIKKAIEVVTEDKESKEDIEKLIKEVKNEINRSNSLFFSNN